MILYKEAEALIKEIEKIRQTGKTIGFVPTMGALHKGHISLINASKSTCDITVCSIFVNPTQFNDPKDFEKYPTVIDHDILLLEKSACDILFFPSVAELYPSGMTALRHYDLGDLEYVLEGQYRPGHFQGVCQVMHRLIDIVNPDQLFIGQKDYQQCLVIKRLLELINHSAVTNIQNTIREESGLAMSSRNLRLSNEQKRKAVSISQTLEYIKRNYTSVPLHELESYAKDYLLDNGFQKVDYVSLADADTLQPIEDLTEVKRTIALIAAFIGEVRLIDNMILSE